MKNKKIIIAGGTGFIGQALAARWGKENHVVILTRQLEQSPVTFRSQRLGNLLLISPMADPEQLSRILLSRA